MNIVFTAGQDLPGLDLSLILKEFQFPQVDLMKLLLKAEDQIVILIPDVTTQTGSNLLNGL